MIHVRVCQQDVMDRLGQRKILRILGIVFDKRIYQQVEPLALCTSTVECPRHEMRVPLRRSMIFSEMWELWDLSGFLMSQGFVEILIRH